MTHFPDISRREKKPRMGFMVLGIGFLASILFVGFFFKSSYHLEQKLEEPQVIEFSRGTSLNALSKQLKAKGLIKYPFLYKLGVKVFDNYAGFKAGTYQIPETYSSSSISQMLTEGKIFEPIVLQFTIPEGFNRQKIESRLIVNGVGSKEEFAKIWKDSKLLKDLGIPYFEGFLYPATYSFRKKMSPVEVVRFMVGSFREKLPKGYKEQAKKMGLTLAKAVSFASLIEKETGIKDEMPLVAEVIWRRLKRGSPLGIDAALIYGIKDYKGDIKWQHLKDKKNPYNTRIHKGLPPTPICSPGTSALLAVLNPSDEGYYYYVADIENGTRHHFSKTLSEHNRYVKKLVSATKRK